MSPYPAPYDHSSQTVSICRKPGGTLPVTTASQCPTAGFISIQCTRSIAIGRSFSDPAASVPAAPRLPRASASSPGNAADIPSRSYCRVAQCGRSRMTHGQTWLSMPAPQSCRDKAYMPLTSTKQRSEVHGDHCWFILSTPPCPTGPHQLRPARMTPFTESLLSGRLTLRLL
jgi:hypothetical protein